ncbi:hypothetical protein QGP82_14655 [Leptothoe sp. LEGE 181152]|nr:hypothetical protein [Leptothoe sp. LEGE 181152]
MIELIGNDVYSDGEYIGSVCRKPQGHWTAYLATTTGDEIVGQYDTDVLAAEALSSVVHEQNSYIYLLENSELPEA